MNKQEYSGVIIPLTTPITSDGQIDLTAAARIVKRIARHKLGVFVLGTTGETASINRPDRFHLVEAVVEAADGKIPVYAGIGDNCLANSILAANRYQELGVTAVVAHLPSYYPITTDEMLKYFTRLDQSMLGPWMIYNIPITTHMSIPMPVVKELSKLDKCVGFKDSEGTPGRMETVYEAVGGRDDFALFMGSAVLSMAALKMGYRGLVPSSGNLVPHLWRELWDASLEKDWGTVEERQRLLDEIAFLFQKDRTLGQSLAALKAALNALHLCEPVVLPPLQTFSKTECEQIRDQIFHLCPFLEDEVKALSRVS
jgi:4-hydroxy-tetrahydrodipicolinate synthase